MDVLYWFLSQVGSVIIVSENVENIVTTTEVLRTIIFPFEYDDPYFLSLPKHLWNYLEAPFPCLIGLPIHTKQDLDQAIGMCSEKALIVDLDNDNLIVKYRRESYPLAVFKELDKFSRYTMPHTKKQITLVSKASLISLDA